MSRLFSLQSLLLSSLYFFGLGCAEDTSSQAGQMMGPLAITGSYTDDYGTAHVISANSWTQTYPGEEGASASTSAFNIETYDNELGFLIAQNSEDNEYNPGAWSRFDWIQNGEELWICQSAFAAMTPEEAEAATADPTDPSMKGCGDFPWTQLVSQ